MEIKSEVDQPVGTGLSYIVNKNAYVTNEVLVLSVVTEKTHGEGSWEKNSFLSWTDSLTCFLIWSWPSSI